jgi:hypothetical protein
LQAHEKDTPKPKFVKLKKCKKSGSGTEQMTFLWGGMTSRQFNGKRDTTAPHHLRNAITEK